MLKKRGISPLIATVLLVGITVTAASVLLIWGKGYVKDIQEKQGELSQGRLSCSTDIEIDIVSAESGFITVENKGKGRIDAFLLRIIDTRGEAVNQDVQISIEPGEIKKVPFSGNPDKIDVIPKVRISEGLFQPCSEQHIVYNLWGKKWNKIKEVFHH